MNFLNKFFKTNTKKDISSYKSNRFIYPIEDAQTRNALDIYETFLLSIKETFEFHEITNFELYFDTGLDTYYHQVDELVVIIKTNELKVPYRTRSFYSRNENDFSTNYCATLTDIVEVYNRYLADTKGQGVITTKLDEKKDIVVSYVPLNKVEDRPVEEAGSDLSIVRYKTSHLENLVSRYERSGVFHFLDSEVIAKGHSLAKSYSFNMPNDFPWCYKDLVKASCPRESSGYESEIDEFFKITHNHLTYSDYTEISSDDGSQVKVRFKINNDDFFDSSPLPEEFSFRIIIELNEYLEQKYNTAFYQWVWERNPWEQCTFIYVSLEYKKEIESINQLVPVYLELAEFYEEN